MTETGENTLDANCISCEPGRKVSIVNGVRQVEVTPEWLSDKLGSPAEQLAEAMVAAEMLGVFKNDGPQPTVQRPEAPPPFESPARPQPRPAQRPMFPRSYAAPRGMHKPPRPMPAPGRNFTLAETEAAEVLGLRPSRANDNFTLYQTDAAEVLPGGNRVKHLNLMKDTDEAEETETPDVVTSDGEPFPGEAARNKRRPSDDYLVRTLQDEQVTELRQLQIVRPCTFEDCNERWFLHYQAQMWYRTPCTEIAYKMDKQWGVSKERRDGPVIWPMRPWVYFPRWFENFADEFTDSEGERMMRLMREPAAGAGKVIQDCIQDLFKSGLEPHRLLASSAHQPDPESGDPFLLIERLARNCSCPDACLRKVVDVLYSNVGLVTNAPRIGYPPINVQPQVGPKFRWELEKGYYPDEPDEYYLVVYVEIEWGLNWDILFSIGCMK